MSNMRKQIRRIYDIYQSNDYLDAEDMERKLKEERAARIELINEEYARLLVPLRKLLEYMEHGEVAKLHEFMMAFAPIMMDEVDDAADELDTKRVYDADAVDALFDGQPNPLRMTDEDRHKAYARLMLNTLK